ncbi:unnamed protein product [Linum trigynum]|uniref:Uncharacterized protein n=1 Tax=Linum trigynum TaxID=586398 RepID=A0AAV2EPZ3_9ROSI
MLVSKRSRRNSRHLNKKGKPELVSGNGPQGPISKNGKGGIKASEKEKEDFGTGSKASKQTRDQAAPIQERRGNHNRKGEVEASPAARVGNKGKEVDTDLNDEGKGILGSGPSKSPNRGTVFRPNSEACHPSKSGQSDSEVKLAASRPDEQASSPSVGLVSLAGQASTSSAAHLVKSFVGPNGTRMQIVAVPSSPNRTRQAEVKSPSAGERTKTKKGARRQSKKGSPVKFQSSKALQIWSPVKDRKSKSKARLATLTLEDINAWTCAAAEKADWRPEHDRSETRRSEQWAPAGDWGDSAALQD